MSKYKRITVCLRSGIGNTVMATPLVEALLKLNYKVRFLIHPSAKNLRFMVHGFEYDIGVKTNDFAAIPALWVRSKPKKVSPTQILADDLDPKKHHEVDANMTIARKLGYKGETPNPVVYGVKADTNSTLVIAPGCAPAQQWKKKKYPHWHSLCKKLSDRYKLSFLGTGDESEPWMNGLGLNLCGKMKLRDSINWLAGSRGTIAIDNGLAHISAAVGRPTNVIYGPTLESKNRQIGKKVNIINMGIHCSPCQLTKLWDTCNDYQCMNISPEHIIENLRHIT